MHLGLIEMPFVIHNLISTQESSIPLLNFQMALILKILMPYGSKKGTQIYFFLFCQVPANELLPGSLWGEIPVYRAFHTSRNPHKNSSK
jgi:hypothetical protein